MLLPLNEHRFHFLYLSLDIEEILQLIEQDTDVLSEKTEFFELLHLRMELLIFNVRIIELSDLTLAFGHILIAVFHKIPGEVDIFNLGFDVECNLSFKGVDIPLLWLMNFIEFIGVEILLVR